jgi:hypothetical protein
VGFVFESERPLLVHNTYTDCVKNREGAYCLNYGLDGEVGYWGVS